MQMGEELLGDRRGRLARRSRVAQVAASWGYVGGQQAVGDRWWPLQGKPTVSEGMLSMLAESNAIGERQARGRRGRCFPLSERRGGSRQNWIWVVHLACRWSTVHSRM